MGNSGGVPKWLTDVRHAYIGVETRDGGTARVLDVEHLGYKTEVTPVRSGARLVVRGQGRAQTRTIDLLGKFAESATVYLEDVGQCSLTIAGPGVVDVCGHADSAGPFTLTLEPSVRCVRVRSAMDIRIGGQNVGPLLLEVIEAEQSRGVNISGDVAVERLDTTQASEPIPKVTIGCVAKNFRVVGGVKHLEITAPTGLVGSEIRATESVIVRSPNLADSSVDASDVSLQGVHNRPIAVGGGVSIRTSTLNIVGPVDGDEERTCLEVLESARIYGDCSGVDIVGKAIGGVHIALNERELADISESEESVPPGHLALAGKELWPGVHGRVLMGSTVRVAGDVTVDGSVDTSTIESDGVVTVAGSVSSGPWLISAESLFVGGDLAGGEPYGEVNARELSVAGDVRQCALHLRGGSATLGSIRSGSVERGRLRVMGGVEGVSQFSGITDLWVGGGISGESSIEIRGDATFEKGSACEVRWLAGQAAALRLSSGRLAKLLISPSDRPLRHTLAIAGDGWIESLDLASDVSVCIDLRESDALGRSTTHQPISRTNCGSGVTVDVDAGENGKVDCGAWIVEQHATFVSTARVLVVAVAVPSGTSAELDLRCDPSGGWIELLPGSLDTDSVEAQGELGVCAGMGNLRVFRNLVALEMPSDHGFGLAVEAEATVQNAGGSCQLHGLNGQLFSAAGQAITITDLGHDSNGWAKSLSGGVLVGADVSPLADSQVRPLAALRVLEIDRKKSRGSSRLDDHTRAAAHAQRVRDFADIVTDRAVTGGSRAAARWAAIDAAVATLSSRDWPERSWRAVHRRVFGYGYRPGPPAIALALWLVAVTVVAYFLDDGPGPCDPRVQSGDIVGGPYSLGQQVQRALLMPLQVLRYSTPGSPPYAPYWDNGLATAGIVAVTGVLLAGLIVALKNFLRSPHNRSVEADDLVK